MREKCERIIKDNWDYRYINLNLNKKYVVNEIQLFKIL